MKIVALMPMKRHSERIKNKNFRQFAGKPLYRWMLEKLVAVDEIESVVINTDAADLIDVSQLANQDKVIIRQRKKELEGDFVSMNLILADDIEAVDADAYLMTHTTNPLLQVGTIKSSINKFYDVVSNGEYDSVFSVTKMQTRFYDKNVSAINHDPNILKRTQDLEPWFEENSCFYLFTKKSFEKTNARIGKTPYMFEIESLESVDIDEPADWIIAESIAMRLGYDFDIKELARELSK